jgi:hypothetical protein
MRVIRASGLQTSLSRENLLRSALCDAKKGDNRKKSARSLRGRRAWCRGRLVVDVPFAVAEEKGACSLLLTSGSIHTERMCPVAACRRGPILAAPHCRESPMLRMAHRAGDVGTAKTVVVPIRLARAELATTSAMTCVAWRVFPRAMARSHASSDGFPASVVPSRHDSQGSSKNTGMRTGVSRPGGVHGRLQGGARHH